MQFYFNVTSILYFKTLIDWYSLERHSHPKAHVSYSIAVRFVGHVPQVRGRLPCTIINPTTTSAMDCPGDIGGQDQVVTLLQPPTKLNLNTEELYQGQEGRIFS